MEHTAYQRILICVLDWGIGHASRSLALANQLMADGHTVAFASAGRALKMLEHEAASEIQLYQLPAYNIDYRSSNMIFNIGRQLPKIIASIGKERNVLNNILSNNKYDLVISDSRFGCYSKTVKSVMLTHQLNPIFGIPLAGFLYRRYLQYCFDAFWIPDFPDETKRMSGKLSRSNNYKNATYIGTLSRLATPSKQTQKLYTTMCLLSGPEPQRSYLENGLFELLQHIKGHHLIISGKPDSKDRLTVFESQSTRIDHLAFTTASKTALLLRQSKQIICRSGYSTLMDLNALEIKNIILVPTPGQTEQIYLAQNWKNQGRAQCLAQEDLKDLPSLLLLD